MPDRTVAPPFVKTSSFDLITPEETKLSNGIRLLFVHGGFQDVMKIEFVFHAGRWFEEKLAAAYFTAHLLSKGTRRKGSFEIAQLFDQYGAHLEVSPGLDFVSISLYTLNKNLATVLNVLTEILSEPTFPENEFRQTQTVFNQNLRINNEKTSFVASQLFRKSIFGNRHPYGTEVTEKDVADLKVEHLQNHFQRCLHSATVCVSGRIEAAHRKLVADVLQQFTHGLLPSVEHDAADSTPRKEYQEKKDSVQSSVRVGMRSLVRSHPDYPSVLFASHILGGYFGSRLMKNIREEKGLTYGISASIHAMKHDSFLVIGADVNKENVNLTFDEIRKEFRKLRTEEVSADELETSRNHFIGSLQSEITTPFAHAEKIKTINLYNLRSDHYQNMISRIESITPAEILRISEQYFQESLFFEVAVG